MRPELAQAFQALANQGQAPQAQVAQAAQTAPQTTPAAPAPGQTQVNSTVLSAGVSLPSSIVGQTLAAPTQEQKKILNTGIPQTGNFAQDMAAAFGGKVPQGPTGTQGPNQAAGSSVPGEEHDLDKLLAKEMEAVEYTRTDTPEGLKVSYTDKDGSTHVEVKSKGKHKLLIDELAKQLPQNKEGLVAQIREQVSSFVSGITMALAAAAQSVMSFGSNMFSNPFGGGLTSFFGQGGDLFGFNPLASQDTATHPLLEGLKKAAEAGQANQNAATNRVAQHLAQPAKPDISAGNANPNQN